jgi:predicted Zn-ribbon and HTH transcriptional regulator
MPQSPLLTYDMWHFGLSKDKDSDFGEDDSSGVRMQPDHFPNVARPGGGYHKDTIVDSEKPAVFCDDCNDEIVDGSCLRCDWGEQNRAVPMPNYPLDPFRDDKAGIRAGSWKFGMAPPPILQEEWDKRAREVNKSINGEDSKGVKWLKNVQGARIKTPAKCLDCGYKWDALPARITQGTPCPQCSRNRQWENQKTSQDQWDEIAANVNKKVNGDNSKGVKWLETVINGSTKAKAECLDCGYGSKKSERWFVRPDSFVMGTGCPNCEKLHRRKPQEYWNEIASQLNPPIKWLEDVEGVQSPTKAECLECGYGSKGEWAPWPVGAQKGSSCPRCAKTGFDPTSKSFVYLFKHGPQIKIGITNNLEQRIKQYQKPFSMGVTNYQTEQHPEQEGMRFRIPTDLPDIENWNIIDTKNTIPTNKKLLNRGLKPFNIKNPGNKMGPQTRGQQRIVDPKYLYKEDKKKTSADQEGNAYYAFSIPKGKGYLAQNIEYNIIQWWMSLGLSVDTESTHHSESITTDLSRSNVDQDLANDLNVELHAFLIQKMIENGGHMEKLSEVFSQKDEKTLSNFFDNNSDKINAAFGMTWDPEQNKYVPGNDFGEALNIDEAYIPVSNWSFEESVEEPTEEQIQNIQTQRAMQLSEDQQRALQAPQLSPNFYGDQRFQEELAKHPEWAETAIPETQVPQDLRSVPRGDFNNFEGIRINQPYRDPINGDVRMIDENNQQWIAYNGQWTRVANWSGF